MSAVSIPQIRQRIENWQSKGYVLRVLLWFWVLAFLFVMVLSILGIESFYQFYASRKSPMTKPAIFFVARDAVVGICYFTTAVWFVINYAGKGMSLLAAYALLCAGFTEAGFADAYVVHNEASPEFLAAPFFAFRAISSIVFAYFVLLFPNGKFVPLWAKYYAYCWTLLIVCFWLFPALPFNFMYYETFRSNRLNYLVLTLFFFIPVGLQVYRYFASSSKLEREQIRWIVIGMGAFIVGVSMDYGMRYFFALDFFPRDANGFRQPYWFTTYGRNILQSLGYSIFPFTLIYALSKNTLWRPDPFAKRILLYSSLTLTIVIIYASIVGLLTVLFQQRLNFFYLCDCCRHHRRALPSSQTTLSTGHQPAPLRSA